MSDCPDDFSDEKWMKKCHRNGGLPMDELIDLGNLVLERLEFVEGEGVNCTANELLIIQMTKTLEAVRTLYNKLLPKAKS